MELHQKGWLKTYIQYALDENLFEIERPKIWSDKKLYPYLYHVFRQTGFFHAGEQTPFLESKLHQNIQNHSEKNKLILLDLYLFFIKKKFPDKNLTKIVEDFGFYIHLIYQKELPNIMSFSKIEDVFEKYIMKKEVFSQDQEQGLYFIDLYFFLEYYQQSPSDLIQKREEFVAFFHHLLTFLKNENPNKEREKIIQVLQKSLQNLVISPFLTEKKLDQTDFSILKNNWMLKKFSIEKVIFIYLINNEEILSNHPIHEWLSKIEFSILDLEESISYVENFILNYQNNLNNTGFFSKIYQNLTRKIKKEYYTHKKNILQEINESSELAELLKKSATTELSEEEKTKVKKQLLDILKSIPAFGIFLLPGGAILLPILLKILPKELLLPSSYYDSEEEEIK